MARKPAAKSAVAQAQARAAAAKRKPGGGMNRAAVLMIVAALVPFSLPTATVLVFTMLPTMAAYFSERGNNRYAWLCVGGLNFAGVIPFLFTLWFGVHTEDEALRLISDGNVLVSAYATSALGWMIYKAMPPLVGSWLKFSTERRIGSLKAAQRKLVEEWGDEVTRKQQNGTPPAAD